MNSWRYITPVQIWNSHDKVVWIDGKGWTRNPYRLTVTDDEVDSWDTLDSRKMRKRRNKKNAEKIKIGKQKK